MKNQHTIFVCTSCANVREEENRDGQSGGQKLLEQLLHLHQDWDLRDEFLIQPVECMSACDRPCVVSFATAGKYTYLFGDLPVDVETLPATSAALLKCASQYYVDPEGLLPWSEQPKIFKKGILAEIPPLPQFKSNT